MINSEGASWHGRDEKALIAHTKPEKRIIKTYLDFEEPAFLALPQRKLK